MQEAVAALTTAVFVVVVVVTVRVCLLHAHPTTLAVVQVIVILVVTIHNLQNLVALLIQLWTHLQTLASVIKGMQHRLIELTAYISR